MKKVIILATLLILAMLTLVNAIDVYDCQNLDIEGETYVLQNDISTSGNCFEINAESITLDLNKYIVSGDDNGYAVQIKNSHSVIRNGRIQNFNKGIEILDSNKNTLIGNEIINNEVGIYFNFGASDNAINNNYISNNENIQFNGRSNDRRKLLGKTGRNWIQSNMP